MSRTQTLETPQQEKETTGRAHGYIAVYPGLLFDEREENSGLRTTWGNKANVVRTEGRGITTDPSYCSSTCNKGGGGNPYKSSGKRSEPGGRAGQNAAQQHMRADIH